MSTEYGTFDLEAGHLEAGDLAANKNNMEVMKGETYIIHRPWVKKPDSLGGLEKWSRNSSNTDDVWGNDAKVIQPSISYQSTIAPNYSGDYSSPPTSIGSSVAAYSMDDDMNNNHVVEGIFGTARRGNQSLSLHAEAAPYPTCGTPLPSPKHPLPSFNEKLEMFMEEYYISGDYKEFVEQLLGLESESFEDILVSRCFRRSLDMVVPRSSELGGRHLSESDNLSNMDDMLFRKDFGTLKNFCEDNKAGLLVFASETPTKMVFQNPLNRHRLLLKLTRDGVVGQGAVMRAVYGHLVNIKDLELDVPLASLEIISLLEQLVFCGLMEANVFGRIPEDVLIKALEIREKRKLENGVLENGKTNNNNGKNFSNFFPSTPQPQKLTRGYKPHEEVLAEMKLAKRVHRNLLIDFFQSGNFAKLEDGLVDLNLPNFNHELVEAAVNMSLDYREVEQQMVAPLLRRLCKRALIHSEDIQHGLALILGKLDDLELDVPFAKKEIVSIISQCVMQETVSAELIKREQLLCYGGVSGVEVLSKVLRYTPEFSRKIWGGTGDLRFLQEEMDSAIREYFDSRDMEEVGVILGELHLNKELEIAFIYHLLLFSIECDKVQVGLNLVDYLKDVYWGYEEVEKAIEKMREAEKDLALDFPLIQESMMELVKRAEEQGLVSWEFQVADGQHAV